MQLLDRVIVPSLDGLGDVNIQGGRVGQIAETGLVGHEGHRGAILLPMCRLGQIDLLKLHGIFWLGRREGGRRR